MLKLRARTLSCILPFVLSACGKDATPAATSGVVAITCNVPRMLCVQETTSTANAVKERSDCTNVVGGDVSEGLNCVAKVSTHDGSPTGYVTGYCSYSLSRAYYAASRFDSSSAPRACAAITADAGGPGTWVQ